MDSRISRGGDRGHIHGHRCHDLKMIEMASRSKKKNKDTETRYLFKYSESTCFRDF